MILSSCGSRQTAFALFPSADCFDVLRVMSSNEEKKATSDIEKAPCEQNSVEESNHGLSEADLANYYEENAGSLVVDPGYL